MAEAKSELTQEAIQKDIDFIAEKGGSDDDVKRYLDSQNISYKKPETPEQTAPKEQTFEDISEGVVTDKLGDSQFAQGAENLLVNGVLAPMAEVARGVYQGGEAFYETLDSATKLVDKASGGILKRGGMFGDFAETMRYNAESIPKTNMHNVTKGIYQFVGGIPPVMAKYALAQKVMRVAGIEQKLAEKALQGLSTIGQFAFVEALDEYGKTEDIKGLVTGAARGAATGMVIGSAIKVFQIARSLMQSGRNEVARRFIMFTTKDKRLAQEYVKNPNKYNLKNDGVRKTSKEVKAENDRTVRLYKEETQAKTGTMKETRAERNRMLVERKRVAMDKLTDAKNLSQSSLDSSSKVKLDEAHLKAQTAVKQNEYLTNERMAETYDGAIKKFEFVKEEYGKAVDVAVGNAVKKTPNAAINSKTVMRRFSTILRKSPFKVSSKGKVSSSTTLTNKSDIAKYQALRNELKHHAKQGTISVGYLQELKIEARNEASKYYAQGNNRLGKLYEDISEAANPANIASTDKVAGKLLKDVKVANDSYSAMKQRYNDAMSHYFKKDANGNIIPDIKKAIRAIEQNDTVALRAMTKADTALPPEDRLLPKVRSIVKEAQAAQQQEKATVMALKQKVKVEKQKLKNASTAARRNLVRSQDTLKQETSNRINKEINEFTKQRAAQLQEMEDSYNRAIYHMSQEEALMQGQATGGTLASRLQSASTRFALWGAAGSFMPGEVGQASKSILGASAAGMTFTRPDVSARISRAISTSPTRTPLEEFSRAYSKGSIEQILQQQFGHKVLRKHSKRVDEAMQKGDEAMLDLITGTGEFFVGGNAEAEEFNIDRDRLEQIESSGRADAVSNKGAVGIRQITQPALTDYNNAHKDRQYTMEDMKDVSKNREVSDWYLDTRIPQMLKSKGVPVTEDNVLRAYNGGAERLSRSLKSGKRLPKETRDYVTKYKRR